MKAEANQKRQRRAVESEEIDDKRRQYLDGVVETSKQAASSFRSFDQKQVDEIVWRMVVAGLNNVGELATTAIDETGLGVLEDKVIKNYTATEFLYDYLRDKKTVGIIEEDRERNLMKVAEPIGVILAILPLTNPTSTTLFKGICAAKTRNAIIMRPSSRAYRSCVEAADIIRDAAEEAGAPKGAIQVLEEPTRADTQYLFHHPDIDFIWTTGGQQIVTAANEAGKPTLGVGPGNAPVYIEKTADIGMAVVDIMVSKTFDASLICPAEQTAVVDAEIYDSFVDELEAIGGRILTGDEVDKLAKTVFNEDGAMNMMCIGQKVTKIAEMAGFEAAPHHKALIAPIEIDGKPEQQILLHEKLFPVLTLVKAHSTEEAISICERVTELEGLGHTSAIFSENDSVVRQFANRIRTGRILVNAPTAVGALGGVYNDLTPTFSLGCGTWGGSTTTENVNVEQLMNIKTVSKRRTPSMWFRVPPEIYFNRYAIENINEIKSETTLIVTTRGTERRGTIDRIRAHMPDAHVHVFSDVEEEPTVEGIEKGAEALRLYEPDALVAVGGGSVLDAAKTMRLFYEDPSVDFRELALPFLDPRKRVIRYPEMSHKVKLVCVPTTSGTGSEVSPAAVITDETRNRKVTLVDYSLVPEMSIVDPDLTLSMPPVITADTGIDALTHAVEAFVSIFSSPYTDAMCLQAINLIFESLPIAYSDGSDIEARSNMHNAATIAGLAFSNAFLGVNHALAHALGAKFGISHGRCNALFLPHVITYNSSLPSKFMPAPNYKSYVAPERYAQIGRVILRLAGENDDYQRAHFEDKVKEMLLVLDLPQSIEKAGIGRKEFEQALPDLVKAAFEDLSSRTNPRMPQLEELHELFEKAWSGWEA